MAGPMPGLLSLVEELYGRINKDRLFGTGVRGAAIRGLLGADAPPDATGKEMEAYRNFSNASMALAAGPVAATRAIKGAKTLKDAPQAQALETARQNAVKMLGLPETNTAMDRARAMGFTDAYHGTNDVIEQMSREFAGKTTYNPSTGLGISVATSGKEASRYPYDFPRKGESSPNVMPLMVRFGKQYDLPYNELNDISMGLFYAPGKTPHERYLSAKKGAEELAVNLNKSGYDTIRAFTGKPHEEIFVPDPSRIRSRFAAFDPARINEKDLLASLAAMGITLPLTMGLLSEQTD